MVIGVGGDADSLDDAVLRHQLAFDFGGAVEFEELVQRSKGQGLGGLYLEEV